MYELQISSSSENYSVQIGANFQTISAEFDALVIDAFFENKIHIDKPVFWVKATEDSKNLSQVESICGFLKEKGLTRASTILAVGGGVVQDLATLAASIYMRGIKWSFAPTTLTGMMDSCLGGKSSINVGKMKNLVGNIYPPTKIYVDGNFVTTLDHQSINSGLAEGVKIVFARGNKEFEQFLNIASSPNPDKAEQIEELIKLTLVSKKWFIEIDEFDKAERQLLNFGHSFGHAFEAACNFRVQHGIGVALGILAALNHPAAARTESTIQLREYCKSLLKQHSALIYEAASQTDWNTFEQSLRSDKKNTSDNLVLILPSPDEGLEKIFLPFAEDNVRLARDVMQSSIDSLLKEGSHV